VEAAKVTVVIPNFNGINYIEVCLNALMQQTEKKFNTIVVDNGSTDGSLEKIKQDFPFASVISFEKNEGFSKAVNAGIRAADTPYVLLLNNDTKVMPDFVEALVTAIETSPDIFSVSAKMIQYHAPEKIDGAGDSYCILGWARARGKDMPVTACETAEDIFSACAGAAIYRRAIFEEIGYFDDRHFAYLEDVDVGYRARIYGYRNCYEPKAKVYHVGSAVSGSRHNAFKVELSARNSVYLNYKNMPAGQYVANSPFLAAGWCIKLLYFTKKGLAKPYLKGTKAGFAMCRKCDKVPYRKEHAANYRKIQGELWKNIRLVFRKV
jgi:GT2 family glycosyltransferase